MARGRKWTDSELDEFKFLVSEGYSNNKLANHYQVSVGRISQLRNQVGLLLRPRKANVVVPVHAEDTSTVLA